MADQDIRCVLRARALNGERPGWSEIERRLYWVDMRAPSLHAFDPATGQDQCWEMPDWIGCYAFAAAGGLVVALRTGFFAFDPVDGALSFLAPPPYDPRRFCFNDGRCDRQGRFYVGPMYSPLGPGDAQPAAAQSAPVWRYGGGDRWLAATPPVKISNGLAWSPDGRLMYHSDTSQKTIWVWTYDPETGSAENQRVFAQVERGGPDGGPDGACVDRDGYYVCAIWGAGELLRFDPNGRLERAIRVPARYPTMPAFGGEDLATLFVTSASYPIPEAERGAYPEAGGLFAMEAPVPGLPPDYYQSIENGHRP
ncbi:MAG: SMP-30/gluconolactonase/LRE family protein [Caulobacterales bacterium]